MLTHKKAEFNEPSCVHYLVLIMISILPDLFHLSFPLFLLDDFKANPSHVCPHTHKYISVHL